MLLYISPRLINLKEIVVYPNKNVAGDAAQRLSQLLPGFQRFQLKALSEYLNKRPKIAKC
jgi:hypothetical protein